MLEILISLFQSLGVWFRSNAKVRLQIVALRHQLAVSPTDNIRNQAIVDGRSFFLGLALPASGRIGALRF